MSVKVRFAPSPTGKLHIGNIRTALINWMFAKKNNGIFILRLDDTDIERSTDENAEAIKVDLRWLGINFDEEFKQSERFSKYDEVAEMLKSKGLLYPCYETQEELERKRRIQLARGLPPIYGRDALELSDDDRKKLEDEGRKAHWRFKLEPKQIIWNDHVRGEVSIDLASLSDPILIRENGTYLYTLPSVIDDIDYNISHVVRGEDHVTNTAVQINIFEQLGAKPPQFAHHNLLTGKGGEGLSKRLGSLSIQSFREHGYEPMTIVSYATLIGSSDAIEPYSDYQILFDKFSFEKLSRAPSKFSEDELKALNAKLLHTLDFDNVKKHLNDIGLSDIDEDFWLAIRGNIIVLSEAKQWWELIRGAVSPKFENADDKAFCAEAISYLPDGEFAESSWKEWIAALKENTSRKGRGLFLPLRLCLTAMSDGPELSNLLPLLGRDKTIARLKGDKA